jgi:predicted N-acetyltransferase YhbS
MPPRLRPATDADLPAIRSLRREVGWQVSAWALHDAMHAPNTAFYALEDKGRLVAIGSGIAYGRLGVVGNMIVASDRRREGLGSRVLRAVLDFLEGEGADRIELFATPDGRPLYEQFGFEPMPPGVLIDLDLARVPRTDASALNVRAATTADLDAIAAYDLPRFGGDRSAILGNAVNDPDRPSYLADRDGAVIGYAVARPADGRIGPWLADDIPTANALLSAITGLRLRADFSAHPTHENALGRAWLTGLGGHVRRTDGRMGFGPHLPRRMELIYGNVVGALG